MFFQGHYIATELPIFLLRLIIFARFPCRCLAIYSNIFFRRVALSIFLQYVQCVINSLDLSSSLCVTEMSVSLLFLIYLRRPRCLHIPRGILSISRYNHVIPASSLFLHLCVQIPSICNSLSELLLPCLRGLEQLTVSPAEE